MRDDGQLSLDDLAAGRIPDPPPPARRPRPVNTVAAAARFAAERSTELQRRVLIALAEHGPQTDHELAARLDTPKDSTSKRRGEARDAGLVTDTGQRRLTPRGREAAVWGLTVAGRDLADRWRIERAS